MQINITGQHLDITPAIKAYVENKFERLQRYSERISNIHVILSVEKERHIAEATLHVSRGELFANEARDDLYHAITSLTEKLDRQLKRHKEKLSNHHKKGKGVKK